MHQIKKSIFFVVFFLSFTSLCANPFFSQEEAAKDSSNSIEKEVLPVRIKGGNPNLIKTQGTLREKLADIFIEVKNTANKKTAHSFYLFLLVLAFSFLYGTLHAAGPGHRKTIVFSLYLTRVAPFWEPLAVAFFLSLLHGGSAIALMLIFKGVAGSVAKNTNIIALYMEGFSYILIIAVTLWLIIHESIEFAQNKTQPKKNPSLIPFLISGIYPCPGAILVLVLAYSLDIFSLGIISVLAMSIGMGVPIALAACLSWSGRTKLFSTLKSKEKKVAILSYCIQMIGFSCLLIFSLYISWPFLYSFIFHSA